MDIKDYSPPSVNGCDRQYSMRLLRTAVNWFFSVLESALPGPCFFAPASSCEVSKEGLTAKDSSQAFFINLHSTWHTMHCQPAVADHADCSDGFRVETPPVKKCR